MYALSENYLKTKVNITKPKLFSLTKSALFLLQKAKKIVDRRSFVVAVTSSYVLLRALNHQTRSTSNFLLTVYCKVAYKNSWEDLE